MEKNVGFAVVWDDAPAQGRIEVAHGTLQKATSGSGKIKKESFSFPGGGAARLTATVAGAEVQPGAFATRVTIHAEPHSFSFFLRDVNARTPLFVPAYGVAVVPEDDARSYAEIAAEVRARGLVSIQQQIDAEPEETYEDACFFNRVQQVPTWLGLSRDMRFFSVHYEELFGYFGVVVPRYHSTVQHLPESDDQSVSLHYAVGRGAACLVDIERRLDEGALPILRAVQKDDDIEYHLTAFATLETQPLAVENLRGTDYRAGYAHMGGHMLTPEEVEQVDAEYGEAEMRGREEETVCCLHFEAINTGSVPRYAYFTGMTLRGARMAEMDGKAGFGLTDANRVYAIQRVNGQPMPQAEMAILLQPGETVVFEYLVPHQPISRARAKKLARFKYAEHLAACREFWNTKLTAAGQIHVPEPAIDERIAAGLLHLDIAAIGLEPDEPVAATIGWYAPIGSESAPIIQFFDSMGWHDLARRSLDFFLERQRNDGFIQNFGGYQLETGPALWTMGEHWRYTRDEKWVRRNKEKILKSCEFLLAWRERNKREELRGNGYGLIEGKVADPQDFFHSYMLNGLSYLGLQRAAEMLQNVDAEQSQRLAAEAAAYREDIRTSYFESMTRSPLVALGDGSWVPSFSPWSEYPGPVSLYAEGGSWATHGAIIPRDSMIGPLYLLISEVIDPNEPAGDFLMRAHQELHTTRNAAYSQPYYARHDYGHLKRGEVKAYLKTYYNQFTALQDRETYSFWEHYFHASEHKTHEEGWFLMQTRWMLYLEEGDTLSLLPAIPRRWLEEGQSIVLENVASYFGAFTLRVESNVDDNVIRAHFEYAGQRAPRAVKLRLPHPLGRKAVSASGGVYEAASESVLISNFKRAAQVTLRF
jgi:hypothetical protein